MLESEIFKLLQQMMEGSGVEDTVVISGWKDSDPRAKKEFDFLVVSLQMKAIVHIEIKRTLNEKTKNTVTKQLDDGHSILKGRVPFEAQSNWRYIQFILFSLRGTGDQEVERFLESHPHSLFTSPDTDLKDWWKGLMTLMETPSKPEDFETYLNILKFYFHQMFIQEDVLTQGEDS